MTLAARGAVRSALPQGRSRSAAAGSTRRSRSRSTATNVVGRRRSRRCSAIEFAIDAPRRRPQPGRVPRGRRSCGSPTTSRSSPTTVDRLRAGNDQVGVAIETDRRPAGRRLDLADRERLELRGRLRARLPGQRASLLRPAGRARAGRVGHDRGSSSARPSPSTVAIAEAAGRDRDARPPRRPRPLLPAVARRPVDRPRPGGAVRGAVPRLERPGRRRVLPAEREPRQPRPGSRGTSGRRSPPGSRPTTRRRSRGFAAAAAAGNGIAQAFHHTILPLASAADRRTEIRWGLRDFELRFGRRPSGLWLPETAVDLRDAPHRRRGGRPLHDPRPVAGGRAGDRHAPAVPGRAGRRRLDRRRLLRRRAVGGGLVRARGDVRRGPVRPRAGRAPGSRGASADRLDAAARPDRHRRRAVRPPPAVPRPVPRSGSSRPDAADRRAARVRRRLAGGRDRRAGRPAPPDGADRRADVVELPPRRRPLVGGVPGRASTAAGRARCARRSSGSRRRSTRRRSAGSPRSPGAPDPWALRDAYVDVVVGTVDADAFAADRTGRPLDAGDRARALALLEAQRWRLAMFASDGWYWDDPIRPETKQILRSAARAVRIVDDELGTRSRGAASSPTSASSSSPSRGLDGAAIYRTALAEVGQPAHG